MRNVFEGVCNVLKAENSLPFNFDNQGIDYWPRSSDSPAEFKLYIKEFEDFHSRFTPTYLFVCDSSSPDIEDNYTLRLSLWADPTLPTDREKKKDIIERVSGAFQMPQNLSSGKNWSSWVTVWSGNTYKIQDMDEIDVKNLSEILISGIRNTYTNLKEGMERLRKYPLPQTVLK
jgi:hypothetical protein